MARMLPGIETLTQHQERLRDDPEAYRPERCPHCGKGGLHRHGHYERNAPRGEGMAFSLGSLFIPRFYCPKCHGTCSRLPACLSPRRQYWWQSQQAVLAAVDLQGSRFARWRGGCGQAGAPSDGGGSGWQAQFDVHACICAAALPNSAGRWIGKRFGRAASSA